MAEARSERWASNRLATAVQLLLFALGLILVLLGTFTTLDMPVRQALLSIGLAFIGGVIVTLVTSGFGVDLTTQIEQRIGFQQSIRDLGLTNLWTEFADDQIFKQFGTARSIDLLFNTGKGCINAHAIRIQESVSSGCRVRLLIGDGSSPAYTDPRYRDALCPGTNIEQEIQDSLGYLREVVIANLVSAGSSRHGTIEVRAFHCVPPGSLVIVNEQVARLIPYLPYVHSTQVPVYEATATGRNGLLEQYIAMFNRVWDRSDTILTYPGQT